MNKSFFAIIPANVRYDKRLCANAKLLYGEITALCNEKGYCWARNSYFAELYGVDKATVSRWISRLIECGHIFSEIKYRDGSKEIEARYLKLTNEPIDAGEIGIDENAKGGIDENAKGGIDEKVKENNTLLNNTILNKKENKKEKEKPQTENKKISGAVFEIINYLNKKTNKNYDAKYRVNINLINDRLNEGYSIADFKTVIDKKVEEWQGTKWEDYLRPTTLFSDRNFNGYLNNSHYQKLTRNKNLSNLNGKYEYTLYDRFDTVAPNYDIEEYERRSKYNI